MKITVNGAALDTECQALDALLVELGHGDAKVATAINELFVPVALRGSTVIAQGDRIEILSPQQGG